MIATIPMTFTVFISILFVVAIQIREDGIRVEFTSQDFQLIRNNSTTKVYHSLYIEALNTFNFTCYSRRPVEWVFECPHLSKYNNLITHERLLLENEGFEYTSILVFTDHQPSHSIRDREFSISNVSCRSVMNSGKENIDVLFKFTVNNAERFGYVDGVVVTLVKGHVLTGEECQNRYAIGSCHSGYEVNLLTASVKALQVYNPRDAPPDFIACDYQMDFCESLSDLYPEDCILFDNMSTDKLLYQLTKGWNNISALLISFSYPDPLFVMKTVGFMYYAVNDGDDENSNTSVAGIYFDPEQVLDVTNQTSITLTIVHVPFGGDNDKPTTSWYEGEWVEIHCQTPMSMYAKGSQIFLKGDTDVHYKRIEKCAFETVTGKRVMHYITLCRVSKPIGNSELYCEAPVRKSTSTRRSKSLLMLNVSKSTVPKIQETHVVSKTNGSEICLRCSGTALPEPEIIWECRSTIRSITFPNEMVEMEWNDQGHFSSGICIPSRLDRCHVSTSTVYCRAENVKGVDGPAQVYPPLSKGNIAWYAVVALIPLISLLAIIAVYYHKRTIRKLSKKDIQEFYGGRKLVDPSDPMNSALALPYDKALEVHRSEIILEESALGSGEYGIVLLGKYRGKIIAVKTIRPPSDPMFFKALLVEVKILQYIGNHPNIVNLLGACTGNIQRMEMLLLLEYCEKGSLLQFLRSGRNTFIDIYVNEITSCEEPVEGQLTTKDLIKFACQISDAMTFIAEKKIIHGDLAARNVLVAADKSAKVCDFGLAKQLFHYAVYIKREVCPLPVRWMAPESLQDMEFSIESDCWSFGVTLWEIFTLGGSPYPGVDWGFDSYIMLIDGFRMGKPKYGNDAIYEILKRCWETDPKQRPKFIEVSALLREQLRDLTKIYYCTGE